MHRLLIFIIIVGCANPQPVPFTKTVTVQIQYCPDGSCLPDYRYVGMAITNGVDYEIRIKNPSALGHEMEHILHWAGVWYNPD